MDKLNNFFTLTPERVFEAAECSLDLVKQSRQPLGVLYPLNSIENRVYEIPLEGGTSIVGKFYRPERWNQNQILEEHSVLEFLEKNEIPVVNTLQFLGKPNSGVLFEEGSTVGKLDIGIYFCFYPKVQGRSKDELQDDDISVLGRFMARMHRALREMPSKKSERLKLGFEYGFHTPIQFLKEKNFLQNPFSAKLELLCRDIEQATSAGFRSFKMQRVHGDCHWGNLLWFQGQPLFLDFDDLMLAPKTQDLWMMIGGRESIDKSKKDRFVESYSQFDEFPFEEWRYREVFRALRIVHYSYWIARRWEDPSFPKMFPHFGSTGWWNEEIVALHEILELLQNADSDSDSIF